MSQVQTNFRAVDMLGAAKPVAAVVVEAPKKVAPKKVAAPVVEETAVVVEEEATVVEADQPEAE
jgi:hypothetical protein